LLGAIAKHWISIITIDCRIPNRTTPRNARTPFYEVRDKFLELLNTIKLCVNVFKAKIISNCEEAYSKASAANSSLLLKCRFKLTIPLLASRSPKVGKSPFIVVLNNKKFISVVLK